MNIDLVRIEWPSGTVQELHDVVVKQFLTITEPPRLLAALTNSVALFTLKDGRGFQYSVAAWDDLRAWTPIASLIITNLSGTALITDANAANSQHRFYRAVPPP